MQVTEPLSIMFDCAFHIVFRFLGSGSADLALRARLVCMWGRIVNGVNIIYTVKNSLSRLSGVRVRRLTICRHV